MNANLLQVILKMVQTAWVGPSRDHKQACAQFPPARLLEYLPGKLKRRAEFFIYGHVKRLAPVRGLDLDGGAVE